MIPYLMLENVGGYVSLGLVTAGERAHNPGESRPRR
jgi:hypothetical protein